ncbi:lanthionine synthetase-like protein [Kribbella voronezhensis]|uniref:Lanthionine synthetase-like protein n=1 Tax=Kribbella voronezhensis TaxID=2512212 RepID=A0A4R7TA68_9ACTN|nr:lanthionine synthetase LanC family protein [Kribbella voronezhensis]TDU88912.1 lanthionine synthetase-like protein [Kribbella voronezhensis]
METADLAARQAADLAAQQTTDLRTRKATDLRARKATELARGATDWMIEHGSSADDLSLYHGLAGIVLALQESAEHFGDERYVRAVEAGADALAAGVDQEEGSSLYGGLAGVAAVLRAVGRPDPAREALHRVRSRFDGQRWNEMFELLVGNAGIGLGALAAGDLELAVAAVTPYLSTADRTAGGVNWPVRPSPPRSHHIAHGTLGIVYALAAIGQAADRQDLIDLALAGAADVVHRNEAGPDGFLVPHSDPPHRPELIERYSLGWCNGPAGDAQVFRLLEQVTGDVSWAELGDRCWHTVTQSGLPRRVRPGFWDNHGRCCGTAGVLALACDRIVERGDDFDFADVLVDDLAKHAVVDEAGVRWSNYEYRESPPDLAPVAGWAMGNAGIVRELLRYARLKDGGFGGYSVPWPDHLSVGVVS